MKIADGKENPVEELWEATAQALDRGDFTSLEEILTSAGVSIIDLLDANNPSPKYSAEALTWACFTDHKRDAQALLDRGVDPTAGTATGMAALHWAANRGNVEIVNLLLAHRVPLEQKNMYDGTVLNCTLYSIINEYRDTHAEIIEALVGAGAKIEAGTLEWWMKQDVPPKEAKERVARSLGSKTE